MAGPVIDPNGSSAWGDPRRNEGPIETAVDWAKGQINDFKEMISESKDALRSTRRLLENPRELLDGLNSNGDKAFVSLGLGVSGSGGVTSGYMAENFGLLVEQIGDDNPVDPPVFEVTLDTGRLMGLSGGSKKLPGFLKKLAALNAKGSSQEQVTFRFPTREAAARGIRAMVYYEFYGNLNKENSLGDYKDHLQKSGAASLHQRNTLRTLLDSAYKAAAADFSTPAAATGTKGQARQTYITSAEKYDLQVYDLRHHFFESREARSAEKAPGAIPRELAFLQDHVYGETIESNVELEGSVDSRKIPDLFKVGDKIPWLEKALRSVGLELEGQMNFTVSRTVIPPRGEEGDANYRPGEVSYTFDASKDARGRSAAALQTKSRKSDNEGSSGDADDADADDSGIGVTFYTQKFTDFGGNGRNLTLTWELPPEDFEGRALKDDPFGEVIFKSDGAVRPTWATIVAAKRTIKENAAGNAASLDRPDKNFYTTRVTIEEPFKPERGDLVAKLMGADDVNVALRQLDPEATEGLHAVTSLAEVKSKGVSLMPGVGLDLLGLGAGAYGWITSGVDDIVFLKDRVSMGDGFPGQEEHPPRIPATGLDAVTPQSLMRNSYDLVTVDEGDTLSEIGDRNGVSLATMIDWNSDLLDDPDMLPVGAEIRVPITRVAQQETPVESEPDTGEPGVPGRSTVAPAEAPESNEASDRPRGKPMTVLKPE